jgi:choline dehydrogenase
MPGDLRDGNRNSTERHDWHFRFLPNLSHDSAPFPRGRVVGGSSAVNTCIALRGQTYDFDEWAALGGGHWAFEHCLPAFKRLEHDLDFDDEWHGQSGPITIRRHTADELVPMQSAFMEACAKLGYPNCGDHNNPNSTGFGPHAMNKIDGVRMSTARYLRRARGRDNLDIVADTVVRRVVFDARRVVAIETESADGRVERRPCRRVVLCGGAVSTPGILVRSGIGPRAMVDKLGVELVVDAPVGRRLLDHPGAAVVLVPEAGFAHPHHPIIQTTMRYRASAGRHDNEMQIQPISFIQLPMVPLLTAISVVVGKPSGWGELRVESIDPRARPRIVSRLGEHSDDRVKLREALSMAREIATSEPLRRAVTVAWPTREQLGRESTEWMLPGVGSGYHPCGTAPMGPAEDPFSVVDFYGRVRGVEGLVVADASIMPTIPTSNLNLPSIMIGERFGEWLRDGAVSL